MAEQDFLPDEGLELEQSFQPAPYEPLNSRTEASAQEARSAADSSDLLCTSLMVESDYSTNLPECKNVHSENLNSPDLEDLDAYNLIEPPPLDWRSDSSSEAGSVGELEGCSVGDFGVPGSFNTDLNEDTVSAEEQRERKEKQMVETEKKMKNDDLDHSHIQSLLTQLHLLHPSTPLETSTHCTPDDLANHSTLHHSSTSLEDIAPSCQDLKPNAQTACADGSIPAALLFSQDYQKDLLQLLEDPGPEESRADPQGHSESQSGLRRQSSDAYEMISVSHSEDAWHRHLQDELLVSGITEEEQWVASEGLVTDQSVGESNDLEAEMQPAYKNVPGPCDPEDLLDGVIFGAKYLGSTQMQSEKNPSTNARMAQAQEAMDRIKAPEGESQPMTEVDLFISTQRIKVLSAETQVAMMDHALQMISYIADIGNIVVLMARRKPAGRKTADSTASSTAPQKKCWMIFHVFSSEDAQIIAQAIGQAFGVAYQQFLYTNGIKASDLRPGEYSDYLGTQELYNGDLVHFSCSENIREVCISKKAGDILGVAIVESGWGSILPTVVVANLLHGGPAERSSKLSIGDRIMSVNGTSLVGLPIATCQSIIRDLKSLSMVKLSIVHCPPVTMAIIKRPDPKYQLGFSVEDGIICSLMRGGIAERGGIRVGHRIIEINGQSVVATAHEKIIHILSNAVGEIHLKTMPTSTYRLLTGLDQPVFL
ncbi:amyloid-beta A4 precursor protein-binding family A member 3-like isoform X2 [Myxocyprinus asiaticus]|uniref:amyloid-beta A4 precursor protein-binding family A member 3-like isoform X2 n=1 Tax=Myxocyprinus asiaticus TaxID=70543 RepID=UPI0022227853|nr:amyloid-beta A4 precursor protein-binding family A member 3-like isoform X2 [Myxocyprinus asiaticus]